MKVAVITVAQGRLDHLRLQQTMLNRDSRPLHERIVVSIDDPRVAAAIAEGQVDRSTPPRTLTRTTVIEMPSGQGGLPIAAARNIGADHALAAGAELLIFLDVDCLPSPELTVRYEAAAARSETGRDLLCGPVAYLPPPPAAGYDLDTLAAHPFHPARPAPPAGHCERLADHRLFWSLSFAVSRETWLKIGGFCEEYRGYGAEDTDFAMTAQGREVDMTWVGGAAAYHQWHPSGSPPLRHLDDILRNGAIFARRWGWWPMAGWLRQFEERGLIAWSTDVAGWVRIATPDPQAVEAGPRR